MHRQIVPCQVKSSSAGGGKNTLTYTSQVTLHNGYTLAEGNWYAMLVYNMDLYNTHDAPTSTAGEAGALVAYGRHQRSDRSPRYLGTGNHALIEYRNGLEEHHTYQISGVPFLSQWQRLTTKIEDGKARHFVEGARLRPQGVLLCYEVGVDILDPMAIRRYGLYSNALSFAGYYDLDTEHLYQKFQSRGADGIGYPEWREDSRPSADFALSYAAPHKSLSSHSEAERPFPWDLPQLSQPALTPTQGTTGSPAVQTLAGASCSPTVVMAHGDQAQWRFWATGKGTYSRRSILFWGMPRVQVQSPATYLWVGIYSEVEKDRYKRADFAPQEKLGAKVNKVNDYRRELQVIKAKAESPAYKVEDRAKLKLELEAKEREYGPLLEEYHTDYNRYLQYEQELVQQITPRTQPILVLHQTNVLFSGVDRERKVSHGRTILTSDLMLTELYRREEGGKNYSAVELYNPTWRALNLNDYALVRLADSGSHLSFRKRDGQLTDNLNECIAANGHYVLSSLQRNQILVGNPADKRLVRVSRGVDMGKAWYTDLFPTDEGDRPLLPAQSFVVGASGWQVIDATAPIGPDGLAFSGSYSDYKRELAKYQGWAYSLRRTEGVNFPFIPPYRTRKMTTAWCDDWVLGEAKRTHTLGARSMKQDRAYSTQSVYVSELSFPDYSLDRTPLDPNYGAYRRNRPSAPRP